MTQTKISLEENQIKFINKYSELGFKDKSSLVRMALEEFRKLVEKQKLTESAQVYAELYAEHNELKEFTKTAINGWPE